MATPRERLIAGMISAAMRMNDEDALPTVDGAFGAYIDAMPSDALIDLLIERRAITQVGWCYRPEQVTANPQIAFYGLDVPGVMTGEPVFVREAHD